MKEKLLEIKNETIILINNTNNEQELLKVKADCLGKNSKLNDIVKELKNLTDEDRRIVGKMSNDIREELENLIKEKLNSFQSDKKSNLLFDVTTPIDKNTGTLSPITIVSNEVTTALKKMGFIIATGPEMETEHFNFEALNVPATHPARDMQDTYWTDEHNVLRTHTSPVQARTMLKYGAPIRMCAPGRCFRNEDIDACHENTFFQLEGMVIDKEVSIGNLIYVMKNILKEIYRKDVDVRLRPGFFPFTEPSFELDIKCLICNGKGCPTCKNSGWSELCPCGMIHPSVLEMGGIDSKIYSGFAFGIGLTRMAMFKYNISDIRVLNSGDIRKLKQFGIE